MRRWVLIFGGLFFGLGCGQSATTEAEGTTMSEAENESSSSRYAAAATADADFLETYSATHRFRSGHPRAIQVLPDGSGVMFLRSGPRDVQGTLYFFDVAAGEERQLLTAEQLLGGAEEELSVEERARRERMRLTARGLASFRLSRDGEQLLVPLSGRVFVVAWRDLSQDHAIRELTLGDGGAIDPQFSPDGGKIAFVRQGDLFVADIASGEITRLTTRPQDAEGEVSTHVQNGLAEFVAQEEMSRMHGFFWSPDGRFIAYQQTDTSGMERMHILDPMHPEQEPQSWPYPRPGQANAVVRVGVVDVSGGETRWIDWNRDAYPYFATLRWSEDAPLTLLVQNREQEEERLLRVDLSNMTTRTLLTETDAAWLNLDQSVPRWIHEGSQFLWSSEASGQFRLELRDAEGALVRALTPEGLDYRKLLTVDEERDCVWVLASRESMETHVFRVPLEAGEPTQLTEASAEHHAVVADDGSLWVQSVHDREGLRADIVRRADGTEVGRLQSAAEQPTFTPNVTFETVGRRDWRTVIVRPRNFDASLRYPVIVYVYGGPHHRAVTATRQRYLLSQWQADHNFIVVTIDGRGTPGRGRTWERAIDGDFISAPLEDQVEALQQLGERHPEMDMERVGIWGWSFGGYFSAMAVLQRPSVYRAAVAGAPVSEWRDYDTHYTERYLGLPEPTGEEGAYQRSSVLTFATPVSVEAHRPLLIIHGTADDNVYFSHALKMQNTLFRAGRPADLLALSGLTHMVPEPNVMRRMHGRIMNFFESHLRREPD